MLKIKKRADIEAERQAQEAERQREEARLNQRDAEIAKLTRSDLTLEQKVEVLWKLAGLDRAPSDEKAPPKEPKEPGGGGKEGKL